MKKESKKHTGGWEIMKETLVDDFEIFSTTKSIRKNPRTGASIEFFRIDGHDWANIIALTPKNEVILVRQYRHGSEEFTLELPGGCVEPGEDPKAGVLRELREETGYLANDAEYLGRIRPNPAMMSNYCSFYLARNVTAIGATSLDAGENIEVVLKPLDEVKQMILREEFGHGLQVAAFALMLLRGK